MSSFLITGGTGSFGSAAAKALLAKEGVSRVVIFSRDEQKQDQLRRTLNDERVRFFVGDVRDEPRLLMALRGIDVVLHAAAMKIVPTCEYDPIEAVKTNVGGTANVVSAALRSYVSNLIVLSTDKAASPNNLYGATKLAAEKIFIAANNLSGEDGAKFSVARYGNVSGSRGSAIPVWRSLAARGLALPITDPEMTRFWIDIAAAVEFVLEALLIQRGGEIFIPKMPSYRVGDLAAAVWGRSEPLCEIIGLRPGEKVHEDLITIHEGPRVVQNEAAYVVCPPWLEPDQPCDPGFHLTSANNPERLGVDDLRERLRNVA